MGICAECEKGDGCIILRHIESQIKDFSNNSFDPEKTKIALSAMVRKLETDYLSCESKEGKKMYEDAMKLLATR